MNIDGVNITFHLRALKWQVLPGSPRIIKAQIPHGFIKISQCPKEGHFAIKIGQLEFIPFESEEAAKRFAWHHHLKEMLKGLIANPPNPFIATPEP